MSKSGSLFLAYSRPEIWRRHEVPVSTLVLRAGKGPKLERYALLRVCSLHIRLTKYQVSSFVLRLLESNGS